MDVIYNAIDVSKHQGKNNWEAVKNAGVTHAMLRAGYGRYKNQVDPQFERNSAECERLGIQYGVYWYSYASTPAEARQEARCCLAAIQGKHLCLPVAYDIEYEPCILRLTNAQRTALVEAFLGEVQDAGYYGILYYLDGIDVHKTHQGYFSIDKKKGKKARFVEGKIDRKTQLSDDVDAYDLIMKDKERLLSLDEPVRFIFSHSALREGWDNPNVFQICTLKPQSESEIRSRQEIGRGLRLCVNQQGERMDESVLGRDVQELNKLTLITDLEYGKFAEALQTGLAESLADRPQKVDTQLFVGRTLVDANGEQVHVTQDLANAIYEDLIQKA